MQNENILASISQKGNGEIYLGVVGAVRTGKSTFIKNLLEKLVIPNIEDEYEKKKCLDEMPQSSQGKQIMTLEPKFVPSSGTTIKVDNFKTNIKLVDCVGYIIKDAKGFLDEEGNPRMVKCPWFDDYIPLTEAAEIGTEKVIKDHATIAIVVTTDGTVTEFSRESYIEAEEKTILELKEIGKPFVVVLNTSNPESKKAIDLANSLKEKYEVPVIPCSVLDMSKNDVNNILRTTLYEFPIENINIKIPKWIECMPDNYPLKMHYFSVIKESIKNINKLKDTELITSYYKDDEYIKNAYISEFDSGKGIVTLTLDTSEEIYKNTLLEIIGKEKLTKSSLLSMLLNYKESDEEISNIKTALKMAKNVGYGIMHPTIKDMKLETPEIVKQGSRFGVKLKASASSVHLLKIDVESTFEPIIGSEMQAKELVNYIMKDYDEDKNSIWKSEIFGRSLEQIVKEGIEAKLAMMPDSTRFKLQNTITKIVNKGANNLIAIVI